jgi:hypothetical protein
MTFDVVAEERNELKKILFCVRTQLRLMEGMKALPFFFVLLAGYYSVRSGTSFTLLRFYLSPNCTDNYIAFVYRQDTVGWYMQY